MREKEQSTSFFVKSSTVKSVKMSVTAEDTGRASGGSTTTTVGGICVVKSSLSGCARESDGRGDHTVEKHAIKKLIWLRDKDRRRSAGELMKALQHQRIYIDQSAVHYIAAPRSTGQTHARNSVFKLSQRYNELPDADQVRRIHQMFTKVREDADSGDEDVFAMPRRTNWVRKGGGDKDKKTTIEKGSNREGTREGGGETGKRAGSTKGGGWQGQGRKEDKDPTVTNREGDTHETETQQKSRSSVNADNTKKGGGGQTGDMKKTHNASLLKTECKSGKEAASSIKKEKSGGDVTVAQEGGDEDPHLAQLRQWLNSHPLSPQDIVEAFSEFGKTLEPAVANGALSVETLGEDTVANSFTDLAAEEVLGGNKTSSALQPSVQTDFGTYVQHASKRLSDKGRTTKSASGVQTDKRTDSCDDGEEERAETEDEYASNTETPSTRTSGSLRTGQHKLQPIPPSKENRYQLNSAEIDGKR